MKWTYAIKRKIIQIAAFGFANARVGNLAKGELYTGSWKKFCQPGMNCYSCPAAQFACPIGAMQAVGGARDHKISFYVIGLVLAFGLVFGRAVCGFLCPFGLIQELLHKIPLPKLHLPKWMTYIKYGIFVVFVLLLPNVLVNVLGAGDPAFCKYICPVGTLEGGVPLLAAHEELRQAAGFLFQWKLFILAAVLIGCMLIYRLFCKMLCPLGALYGLLNKVSLYGVKVDHKSCVNCGACKKACLMDVDPVSKPDSAECIRCGRCVDVCPQHAICMGFTGGRKQCILE